MALTPQQRIELENQKQAMLARNKGLEKDLTKRFTKPVLTGMSARLLKGDEVERHVKQEVTSYTKQADEVINTKTLKAVKALEQKIDGIMKHLQTVVEARVSAIPRPKDGRTPTKDEVLAIASPIMDEIRTDFVARIKKVEDVLSQPVDDTSDVPRDLAGLEQLIKKHVPKNMGGGGGPGYLFELLDTPGKSKGLRGAYADYVNKYLKVSADGKRLEWASIAGGSLPPGGTVGQVLTKQSPIDGDANWEDPTGAVDSVNGQTGNVVITKSDVGLSNVPNLDTTTAVAQAHVAVTLAGVSDYITIVGQVITRGLINLANHITGRLPFANLTQLSAHQVLGRAGSGTGDVAGITLGNDTILGRSGSGSIEGLSLSQVKTMLGAGSANGLAELDAGGKVPASQLPAYVDDVIEVANFAALPGTGETGKIYVTLDNNLTYRWSGSAYVEISASLALGETSATAYRGDRGKIAYDYSQVGHVPLTGGTMSGDLQVPAEAYGVSWNGNNEVPTKNDLYDKIETITGGGISEELAIAYAVAL